MATKAGSDGNSLSRSLILELQKVEAEQGMTSNVAKLGSTLQMRAENIYAQTKGIRNLAQNAYHNPTRFGCSTVALTLGLSSIYNGDLFTGGAVAFLGAKELYNQCGGGDNSTLQRLLSDIDADVDMVRSLEEGQQKSYELIDGNLKLIQGDVEALYTKLDEIRNLNVNGRQALDNAKSKAIGKALDAKEAYRKALQLFSEAKESFAASRKIYDECARQFQSIKQIAKEPDTQMSIMERMDSLVSIAEEANDNCSSGKEKLDDADNKFSLAMTALTEASKLKDEVIEMTSKAVQSAQDTLQAGIEKVEYTTECKERLEATQKELDEVKERSKDVMRLLDEMSEDIKNAKAEAVKKLDPSDVFVGVGAGILLAPLGTVSALAIGVTSAYAWHNGATVTETTKKVYNYFFSTPQPVVTPVSEEEVLRVKLQETSSGYYGSWVKKRQSYTVGTVEINIGKDEVMQFNFDLNNKQYPISKEDLLSLYSRMFSKLKEGSLEPAHCKSILQRLQTEVISRGGLNPDVVGLTSDRQAAHGLVKAMLNYADKLRFK